MNPKPGSNLDDWHLAELDDIETRPIHQVSTMMHNPTPQIAEFMPTVRHMGSLNTLGLITQVLLPQ